MCALLSWIKRFFASCDALPIHTGQIWLAISVGPGFNDRAPLIETICHQEVDGYDIGGTYSVAIRLHDKVIGVLAPDGSDEDWVRRAQAGDRKAFSELVRRHQRPVYRHLLRMLGSREDALELTQDAFVKAWQALPQWQPEAQFRTWLFRIANNTALDALRHRKLVEFVPLEDSFDAPSSEAGPERQAQGKQEVRQLEMSLRQLAPEHRQILLLREVEEMSYEEIGRVLLLGEGTVKSRLARARAALIELHARSSP